jgi:hypothetical protein
MPKQARGIVTMIHESTQILRHIKESVLHELFGYDGGENICFDTIYSTAEGAVVIVTDDDKRYELFIKPLDKPKARKIPLSFNELPTEEEE